MSRKWVLCHEEQTGIIRPRQVDAYGANMRKASLLGRQLEFESEPEGFKIGL